jgi:two-component system chemotaxis response regulator CheB
MTTASFPPIRVLVVDDSVFNRRSISEILGASPGIEVVGKAADGEEALRLVGALKPDAITLDLEMPRMDGFTFLRILMTKMPTPVIVVSSYSQKENVFKALELGALDFVAKPDRYSDPDLGGIRDELVRKVLLARSVRRLAPPLQRRAPDASVARPAEARPDAPLPQPKQVVAIASSDVCRRTTPTVSSSRSTCRTSSRAPSRSVSTGAVSCGWVKRRTGTR